MVTASTLACARAGGEQAFRELTDPYRSELLLLHCYQILGSVHDAEDIFQEAPAGRLAGLTGFEGRPSPRAWLHKIAVDGCLNALRDCGRRPRQVPLMAQAAEPTRLVGPVWLEPYPGVCQAGAGVPFRPGPAVSTFTVHRSLWSAAEHAGAAARPIVSHCWPLPHRTRISGDPGDTADADELTVLAEQAGINGRQVNSCGGTGSGPSYTPRHKWPICAPSCASVKLVSGAPIRRSGRTSGPWSDHAQ